MNLFLHGDSASVGVIHLSFSLAYELSENISVNRWLMIGVVVSRWTICCWINGRVSLAQLSYFHSWVTGPSVISSAVCYRPICHCIISCGSLAHMSYTLSWVTGHSPVVSLVVCYCLICLWSVDNIMISKARLWNFAFFSPTGNTMWINRLSVVYGSVDVKQPKFPCALSIIQFRVKCIVQSISKKPLFCCVSI